METKADKGKYLPNKAGLSMRNSCCVQVGKYNPIQRAATVLYRGTQFFAVSFAASMVGHSLTKYLVSSPTCCGLLTHACLV